MEQLLEIEISPELSKCPLSRGNIAAKIARANAVSQILTLCDEVSTMEEFMKIFDIKLFLAWLSSYREILQNSSLTGILRTSQVILVVRSVILINKHLPCYSNTRSRLG